MHMYFVVTFSNNLYLYNNLFDYNKSFTYTYIYLVNIIEIS